MKIIPAVFLVLILMCFGCKDKDIKINCLGEDETLSQFNQPTGETIIVGLDGKAYQINDDGSCDEVATIFDPNFRAEHYQEENGNISIISPDGNVSVLESLTEDFESYDNFLGLFYSTIDEVGNKFWGSMTLQSPSAKTVEEYVELRHCILNGTCDFIDNRIDLVQDPEAANNQCLKFTSVAKTDDMVTCKSSICTPLLFFEKGDDLWFSADYYVEDQRPHTLADFENDYFLSSPGPRLVISGDRLAIENKFGDKDIFRHDKAVLVPIKKWFNVKIHFLFDEGENGLIELWQDDEILLSKQGTNLPLFNSIQNSLEIGISASSVESVLFVDNVRIDHLPF